MKKICPCGKEFYIQPSRVGRKKYCCKACFYKYRSRPSGLTYNIVNENEGWFDKGQKPWNAGTRGVVKANSGSIKKEERRSPETEFKYVNGNGYRHLLKKGILSQKCVICGKTNLKRLQVHHIDGNRKNNDIKNLVVVCRPDHLWLHGRKERQYVEGRKALCQNV